MVAIFALAQLVRRNVWTLDEVRHFSQDRRLDISKYSSLFAAPTTQKGANDHIPSDVLRVTSQTPSDVQQQSTYLNTKTGMKTTRRLPAYGKGTSVNQDTGERENPVQLLFVSGMLLLP